VNGPDDFSAKHGDAALLALLDGASRTDDAAKGGPSQATRLVDFVLETGAELWHAPSGDPYITIEVNGHREHHRLGSRNCRNYLARLFYAHTQKAANAAALQDAIGTLSGKAMYDGAEYPVHVRVAGDDHRIYIDVGDATWQAVEITSAGWRILSDPPVRFRRPRGMLALPIPERGGSIDDLRPFVNVIDDDFPLVGAVQIAALRGRGPFPVCELLGEHGSAKSTTTRVIRRMIDPHESELRRPPRNTENLMIAAANNYIVTIENLSYLPNWLSDDLAALATGGGLSKRQLYSDADECILNAQRPILLNGIEDVVTRADLLDRTIVLTCPVIPDEHRRQEADFWRDFEQAHPRVLGALLDAVAIALKNHGTTTLEALPRMADFAVWNVAAEPGCPWPLGTFLGAYLENRQSSVEAQVDGDPVVEVIKALVNAKKWTGTASELLAILNQKVAGNITKRRDLFSKPRQVADALRRLAPGFRRIGIDVTFWREAHTRRRLITIEKQGVPASPASPASDEPNLRPSGGDDLGTQNCDPDATSPPSSPNSVKVSGLRTDGDEGTAEPPLSSYDDGDAGEDDGFARPFDA
jgi:hypothetical protein